MPVPRSFARLAALPGMSPAVPFMVAAVLTLPLIGLGVALTAGRIVAGTYRSFPVLAVNHLTTLGWGTLVAMGSFYQLFPAMIGATARPGKAVTVQFALSVAGLVILVTGFLFHSLFWIACGGIVTWGGVMLFVWLVLRLIPHGRRWHVPATGVVVSLAYLTVAVTWGALMGLNWRWVFWPGLLTTVGVGTHVVLGLGGWFVQLIVSVSYYLLPRFAGVRWDGRLGPLLVILNAGIAALAGAALTGRDWPARLAAAMLGIAGLFYVRDLAGTLRTARPGKPDLTIHHWWAILWQTVVLSVLAIAWSLRLLPIEGPRLAAAVAVLILLGWVTLAIMGQLYKVTPFLMWYYRYARGLTAAEVPRLDAPYYPRSGLPPFYLTLSGSTLLAVAALLRLPSLGLAGGLLFFAGALAFCHLMAVSWIRVALREG